MMPYRQLLPLLAAASQANDQKPELVAQMLAEGTRNILDAAKSSPVYSLAQNDSRQLQRKRRDTSAIACNACRAKKTACDRVRPSCTLCTERKSRCVYRTSHRSVEASQSTTAPAHAATPNSLQKQVEVLQQRLHDQTDLIQALASLPSGTAMDVLSMLRTSQDPFSVLASLQGTMHGRQRPSDHRANRHTAPPTFSNAEYELCALHPAVYMNLPPVDHNELRALITASVPLGEDKTEDSPSPTPSLVSASSPSGHFRSPVSATFPDIPEPSSHLSPSQLMQGPPSSYVFELNENTTSNTALNTTPQDLFDQRLLRLSIEYWTHVPISNSLAIELISFYMQHENTVFYFLDPDLFVHDLVECRSDFCSAFLVNAILFSASQAYTAVKTEAGLLAPVFFRETTTLWRGHGRTPSLTAAVACQIFSVGNYFFGQDDTAIEVLAQGRRMAEAMHLFGPPQDRQATLEHFKAQSPEWLRAASHAAWGSHNWLALHVFFYNGDPLTEPPILPKPGSAAEDQRLACEPPSAPSAEDWTEPIRWSPRVSRSHAATCRFWIIIQEVANVYLGSQVDRSRPLHEQVPLAFAEEKYQKLLAWADSMVGLIDDRNSALALLFQTWFHNSVMHIFRPFLKEEAPRQLKSFTSVETSPEVIFDASTRQLKQIIYTYLSRSTAEMPLSGYFNGAFVVVGHAMLQNRRYQRRRLGSSDTDEGSASGESPTAVTSQDALHPDARLYFLLCVRAWIDLYVCFPTFSEFLQAFLSMALEADFLTASEAHSILALLRERGLHHNSNPPLGVSTLIDFDQALSNPGEASVTALAQKFNDLAAFNEFTSGEDFVGYDEQPDAAGSWNEE